MTKAVKDNLSEWKVFHKVPQEAKKQITGGHLAKAGFTDINPVWRIKVLTERYGPCGLGWYIETTKEWKEEGAKGELVYFVAINLYVKFDGEWSKPIEGKGGSKLINTFKGQLSSNDEALKMATTDAISVACKMLGIAADVYFEKDRTKYDLDEDEPGQKKPETNQDKSDQGKTEPKKVTQPQLKRYFAIVKAKGFNPDWMDACVKLMFDLKSKNDWLASDYKNFTDYMDENDKATTQSLIELKIKKQNKQVPDEKYYEKK